MANALFILGETISFANYDFNEDKYISWKIILLFILIVRYSLMLYCIIWGCYNRIDPQYILGFLLLYYCLAISLMIKFLYVSKNIRKNIDKYNHELYAWCVMEIVSCVGYLLIHFVILVVGSRNPSVINTYSGLDGIDGIDNVNDVLILHIEERYQQSDQCIDYA